MASETRGVLHTLDPPNHLLSGIRSGCPRPGSSHPPSGDSTRPAPGVEKGRAILHPRGLALGMTGSRRSPPQAGGRQCPDSKPLQRHKSQLNRHLAELPPGNCGADFVQSE